MKAVLKFFIFASFLFLFACKDKVETSVERNPKVVSTVSTNEESLALGSNVQLQFDVENLDVIEKKLYLKSITTCIFEIYDNKGVLIWKNGEVDGSLVINEFFVPALSKKTFMESWSSAGQTLGEYKLKGFIPVSNVKGYEDSTVFYLVD